jgi:hypothetical protein
VLFTEPSDSDGCRDDGDDDDDDGDDAEFVDDMFDSDAQLQRALSTSKQGRGMWRSRSAHSS